MDYNAYELLGLSKDATREEIDAAYKQLREKYRRDRFLPGQEGEDAAEKLQQLEMAYKDIVSGIAPEASSEDTSSDKSDVYSRVQTLLHENNLDEAQKLLDDCSNRDGEWYYLQSVLFYKRSWYLESKKQLEFAVEADPGNEKYKDSLAKLKKILASNSISPDKLRTSSRPVDQGPAVNRGNGTCTGSACADCLLCNACCNCMSCMNGC